MKTKTVATLGIAAIAGAVATLLSSKDRRERLTTRMEERMANRMEKAMDRLPDEAPPNLVRNVMPKLAEQHEEMLSLLREQNELLKQRERVAG